MNSNLGPDFIKFIVNSHGEANIFDNDLAFAVNNLVQLNSLHEYSQVVNEVFNTKHILLTMTEKYVKFAKRSLLPNFRGSS